MEAIFRQDTTKDNSIGALIYKLQSLRSDADSALTEDTSTSVQLLVIWESRGWRRFPMRTLLIEHSNAITWDEDKLRELYSIRHALLNKRQHIKVNYAFEECIFVEDMWLLNDTTTLTTRLKWKEYSYTFEITISEGTRKDDSVEPLWISSSERV
jgi:hypothetical protein